MFRRVTFLKWAAIVSMSGVGIWLATIFGWFSVMYTLDVTKLSVVILVLYALGTVWCGSLSWKIDTVTCDSHPRTKLILQTLRNHAEHGWLAVGFCEKLGLTGTVFGFIIMLSGMTDGALGADAQAIQELLARLSSGMATAFITTLVGVVFGLLLHVQYHMLEREIERQEIKETFFSRMQERMRAAKGEGRES